jgi:hypothetical protein
VNHDDRISGADAGRPKALLDTRGGDGIFVHLDSVAARVTGTDPERVQ